MPSRFRFGATTRTAARLVLAEAYEKAGMPTEALTELQTVLTRDPSRRRREAAARTALGPIASAPLTISFSHRSTRGTMRAFIDVRSRRTRDSTERQTAGLHVHDGHCCCSRDFPVRRDGRTRRHHDPRVGGSGSSRGRTHGGSDIHVRAPHARPSDAASSGRASFQAGRPEGTDLRQAARGARAAARTRNRIGAGSRSCDRRDQGRAPCGATARHQKLWRPGEPKGDGFVVQVASLRSRDEADAIARRLSSKGFASFVTTPGASGPRVFRVRVGKFAERGEAETVARRLEKEEQFKPWITR